MIGKPLTMVRAWVYTMPFTKIRVIFVGEPISVDEVFRESAAGNVASPKLWADGCWPEWEQSFGAGTPTGWVVWL